MRKTIAIAAIVLSGGIFFYYLALGLPEMEQVTADQELALSLPEKEQDTADREADQGLAPGLPEKEQDTADQESERFNAARALWEGTRARDYTFVYDIKCYCSHNFGHPVRVSVRDGSKVESILYVHNDAPPTGLFQGGKFFTIDDFFDEIEGWVYRTPDSLHIEYDPDVGYPTRASIDNDIYTADDEFGFIAYNYVPN